MEVVLQKSKQLLIGLSLASPRLPTDDNSLVLPRLLHLPQHLGSNGVDMGFSRPHLLIFLNNSRNIKFLQLLKVQSFDGRVRVDRDDRILHKGIDAIVEQSQLQSFKNLGFIEQISVHKIP